MNGERRDYPQTSERGFKTTLITCSWTGKSGTGVGRFLGGMEISLVQEQLLLFVEVGVGKVKCKCFKLLAQKQAVLFSWEHVWKLRVRKLIEIEMGRGRFCCQRVKKLYTPNSFLPFTGSSVVYFSYMFFNFVLFFYKLIHSSVSSHDKLKVCGLQPSGF